MRKADKAFVLFKPAKNRFAGDAPQCFLSSPKEDYP